MFCRRARTDTGSLELRVNLGIFCVIPRPCTIRDELAQTKSDISSPSVRVIQSPENNVGQNNLGKTISANRSAATQGIH